MDGSLLDDEKRLPPDFFEVLDRLNERGITFAAASGRTYSALEHLFPGEYKNKLAYICDNGACTVIGGEFRNVYALERDLYKSLINECTKAGGFILVVCAESGVYHLDPDEDFFREVGRFYKRHTVVKSFLDIEGQIYKLAVCDKRGALLHGKPLIDGIFGDSLNVQVSGELWMDVMAGGVSKGKALETLRETLGVTRDETMAFGDYFNDADMLAAAEWSFCMENGHEDVKKLTRFTAPSNNAGGVTRCIKEYVLSGN